MPPVAEARIGGRRPREVCCGSGGGGLEWVRAGPENGFCFAALRGLCVLHRDWLSPGSHLGLQACRLAARATGVREPAQRGETPIATVRKPVGYREWRFLLKPAQRGGTALQNNRNRWYDPASTSAKRHRGGIPTVIRHCLASKQWATATRPIDVGWAMPTTLTWESVGGAHPACSPGSCRSQNA